MDESHSSQVQDPPRRGDRCGPRIRGLHQHRPCSGTGEITLNGAAAHKAGPGDLVIICSYAEYTEEEARAHEPKLVYVDSCNKMQRKAVAVA